MTLEAVRIDSLISRGPAFSVWRAYDDRGRALCLKCALDAAAAVALERECDALAVLGDPGIVRMLDRLEPDSVSGWPDLAPPTPVLALEYLDGGDLGPLLGQHPRHWIGAAFELIHALEHMHALGIVHGDVKSSNVLFDARDRARLVDFSCAARVGDTFAERFGTRAYQRDRKRPHTVSEDDDVYAFAVLLYELLTGALPGADPAIAPHERMNFTAAEGAALEAVLEKLGTSAAADAALFPGPDLASFREVLSPIVAGED